MEKAMKGSVGVDLRVRKGDCDGRIKDGNPRKHSAIKVQSVYFLRNTRPLLLE
jgi:hypothetical protein